MVGGVGANNGFGGGHHCDGGGPHERGWHGHQRADHAHHGRHVGTGEDSWSGGNKSDDTQFGRMLHHASDEAKEDAAPAVSAGKTASPAADTTPSGKASALAGIGAAGAGMGAGAGLLGMASSAPTTGAGSSTSGDATAPAQPTTIDTGASAGASDGAGSWGISGKEGLGISPTSANGNGTNMGDASWYSNWSLTPTAGAQGAFVPTVQGVGDASDQGKLQSAFAGQKLALGFNEPDNAGQANISPSTAATAWGNVAGAARNTGTTLASPSVTNSTQPGQGLDWLKQFMDAKTTVNGKQETVGDTVGAINLHWYGGGDPNDATQMSQQVSNLKNYLQQANQEFPNKPIILSEVGVNANGNNASASPAFLSDLQQMLKDPSMNYVSLYAPYGAGTPGGN